MFLLPCAILAQSNTIYTRSLEELYFGRQPSARTEAVGRCGVAIMGDVFSSFYNPAGFSFNNGLSLSGSYAEPYYLLQNANYNFIGINYDFKNYGNIGLSRFRFNYGGIEYNGDTDSDFISMFILSYAFKPTKDFSLGFNIDLIQKKSFQRSFYAYRVIYPVDVGLLKVFKFRGRKGINQRILIGASLFNINCAKIGFEGQKNALPVIFRLGGSYKLSLYKKMFSPKLNIFSILFTSEYQDLFNSTALLHFLDKG
ncbi:MAG: hypothetical protein ACTSWG_06965 [Candidatus Helarchaeota archaeon]